MARWNRAANRAFVTYTPSLDPRAAAAILMATAAIPVLAIAALVPPPLVLPVFGTVSIVSAGLVGLFAWCSVRSAVATASPLGTFSGAFAFIGFAAGMLSKPEHVVQLVGFATMAQ